MSGSKGKSRRIAKDMNWLEIDAILWEMISKWNGKNKQKLLDSISAKFNWSEKQTQYATDLHFRMYDKVKK